MSSLSFQKLLQPTLTYWRRYTHFRWSVFLLEWTTKDTKPFPPLTLWDNREADGTGQPLPWKLTDDRILGGYSNTATVLITNDDDWLQHSATIDDNDKFHNGAGVNRTSTHYPFLHWYGTTDTTVGLSSRAQRSGFSHIQSPTLPAFLDNHYQAIEVTARGTPGRIFGLQLHLTSSTLDRDTYQGQLVFPDEQQGSFATFVLPLQSFTAVSGGRHRENPRKLDQKIELESVGLMLADHVDGEFWLDLARLRAVNFDEECSVPTVYEGVQQQRNDGVEKGGEHNNNIEDGAQKATSDKAEKQK